MFFSFEISSKLNTYTLRCAIHLIFPVKNESLTPFCFVRKWYKQEETSFYYIYKISFICSKLNPGINRIHCATYSIFVVENEQLTLEFGQNQSQDETLCTCMRPNSSQNTKKVEWNISLYFLNKFFQRLIRDLIIIV
jgi:hypothetical protein